MKEEIDKEMIYGRAYSRLNKDDFSRDVQSHDWSDVLNEVDPDLAWQKFKTQFLSYLDKHAPFKYFNTRKNRKPWVTTEFLENANE